MEEQTNINVTVTDLRDKQEQDQTAQQFTDMLQTRIRERIQEEAKIVSRMTSDELHENFGKRIALTEYLRGIRDSIQKTYPKASFVLLTSETRFGGKVDIGYQYGGDETMLTDVLARAMVHELSVVKMVNGAIKAFCKVCDKDQAEMGITALQDIIRMLRERNSPQARIAMMESEVKRLKRAGRYDLVKMKQQEVDELKDEVQAAIDKEKRREENRKKSIERLVVARAALAEKRRKAAEEKALEAERERKREEQRRNQPNFGKMAKEARKKKAAEKAARKKAKSGGASVGEDAGVKSCSQMLMR